MVVSFVLEHKEPVLKLAVNIYLDLYGTSIDLFGLVKILENAFLFQLLCADGSDIHKSDGLAFSAQLFSCVDVLVICLSDVIGINICFIDNCGECGVTAVVRPVCIYHANFGDSGVTLFGVTEIVTAELQVVGIHCKAVLCNEVCKTHIVHGDKSCEGLNSLGDSVVYLQGLYFIKGSLTALDRVDDVLFQRFKLAVGYSALGDVNTGISYLASFALGKYLDTLLAGIGSLVELTGKILHSKNTLIVLESGERPVSNVNGRLGENVIRRIIEIIL